MNKSPANKSRLLAEIQNHVDRKLYATPYSNKLAFHLETVAHTRGLEHELLPLCEEARAMAKHLAAPQAKRTMGELMDEYEIELRATVANER